MPDIWEWSREDFFFLPLSLRNKWWRETNYSSTPPSEELRNEVLKHVQQRAAINS
jgi:hypothetical protein